VRLHGQSAPSRPGRFGGRNLGFGGVVWPLRGGAAAGTVY
jgi:hypothetical protein